MDFTNRANHLMGRLVYPNKLEETNHLRGLTCEHNFIHPKVDAIYQTRMKDTSKGE
jgi:hypothetical protein